MTNPDSDVLEVVVYGNEPEGGGGTDVIQVPLDMVTQFGGTPNIVIINLPPPDGGGGGDTPDLDAGHLLTGFGLVYAAAALFTGGAAGVALGGIALTFEAAAWITDVIDDTKSREAQPDYRRPAGSLIPERALSLSGPPEFDRAVRAAMSGERACAVYVDSVECTLGALLAADTAWVERHVRAGRDAYREIGEGFHTMAQTLRPLNEQYITPEILSTPLPEDMKERFSAILKEVGPMLDLSDEDEAHIIDQIVPRFDDDLPSEPQIRSDVVALQEAGRRHINPETVKVRFTFKSGPPPTS